MCIRDSFNTSSGWVDGVAPNADEIKAYMYGWKATANNGTRYTTWVSAVDGTTTPTVQNIDYVKSNIAIGYDGYKLYYKITTPNELNVPLDNPPVLKKGTNTVTLDTGQVRGEVANPAFNTVNAYLLNDNAIQSTLFKNKTDTINNIYRNGQLDTQNWVISSTGTPYGLQRAYCLTANFDPLALYTVDYTILRSEAPQIGSAVLKYKEGIVDSINEIIEQLPSKQPQSDVLDRIVDLAEYEYLPRVQSSQIAINSNGFIAIDIPITFARKNKTPFVYVRYGVNGRLAYRDSNGVLTNIPVADIDIQTISTSLTSYTCSFRVFYKGTDNTIKTNMLNYGVLAEFELTLDARY